VSDQDFFFDEEEETVKKAPKASASSAAKGSPGRVAPAARKSAAPAAASAGIFEQNVSMTVAALMTVVGLLVGVIIGFVVAPDDSSVAGGPVGEAPAPQLSEDQLQTGELPEGHPDISGMGGSAAPTGTVETPAE